MDTANFLQIVYIFVGLTIIAVGVYLILILFEIYKTIRKASNFLSRTEDLLNFVENKVIRPTVSISGYVGMAKEFLSVASAFKEGLNKTNKKEKKDE